MKEDNQTNDLYIVVSEFLESRNVGETHSPETIVAALCRVLADAVEQVPATDQKKLEAIVRLTAHYMGFEDAMLFLGKDADSDKIN